MHACILTYGAIERGCDELFLAVCMYVCMYVCIYVSMCVYRKMSSFWPSVCMYVRMYVCVYKWSFL